ncbi:MAG: hypothetical protein AAFU03_08785, partial [Bacteroidota bacterium]
TPPRNRNEKIAYQTAFLGQSFSDVQFRLLRSEAIRRIEDYLVGETNATAIGEVEREIRLLPLLRNRRLDKRYAAAKRRCQRAVDKLPDGPQCARLQYEFAREIIENKGLQRNLSIPEINHQRQLWERSVVLETLRQACNAISARTIDPGEPAAGWLPYLLQYLDESYDGPTPDPVLSIYRNAYQMLREEGASDRALITFIEQRAVLRQITPSEARELLLWTINHCIRRVNNGHLAAGNFALDLYAEGLESGFLLDQGELSRFTFSNIVALALKAQQTERARAFIDRYAPLLPTTFRQSTEALNRARLAFEEGRLEDSLDALQSARDEDVLTTLNIRILQMRVYHELAEFRLLDAHLDALDIYLRRKKDSLDYHYKAYRQLIAYVRKYRRLNHHDREQIAKFRKEVISAELLPERNWLIDIIAEG